MNLWMPLCEQGWKETERMEGVKSDTQVNRDVLRDVIWENELV